ncbi:hypothetical protein B9G98_01926 [Wickerhamiella sorbophila]|uniref:Tag1 C-terminal domain-containing protein n=1 Tax=Wickerhamiella sorbophila TaxID=45607 RepID=A0A2T0FH48_9ASCO|nr:hypothetical protein B9G98_01926 [Wickerhamiella sorbophila]PRT54306.1 hypothetical protein B9G98_01926 [Wickerhamiella sorbophila]
MPEPEQQAHESTPLLREIEEDFRSMLREEGSSESIWQLFKDKPATMVLILSLFSLIFLAAKSLESFSPAHYVDAVSYKLVSAKILQLDEDISMAVSAWTKMDYTLVDGPAAWPVEVMAGFVGDISAEIIGPLEISVQNASKTSHLASVAVPGLFVVDVSNLAETEIDMTCSISNIGRPDLLQKLSMDLMSGKELIFVINALVRIRKWGFVFSAPVSVDVPLRFDEAHGELGHLAGIEVGRNADNSLQVDMTAEVAFATIVEAEIPSLAWSVKMNGCDHKPKVAIDRATTECVMLQTDEPSFNVSMSMALSELPENLTKPCDGKKSALDAWLSRYLAGESNELFVEGSSDIPILNSLIHGYNLPVTLSGKPLDDKLIKQIEVNNFEITYGNVNEALITANVIVHIKMPDIIHLKRDILVAVNSVKGPIYLFDDGVRMGQVYIEEWTPTVTVPQDDGFKITLYLDRAPFEVENASQFAKFTRTLLIVGHAPVAYQTLLDLSIQSPIGDMALQGMYFQGKTEVYK